MRMQVLEASADGECDWCRGRIDGECICIRNLPYRENKSFALLHNACAQYMLIDVLAALGDDNGRRLMSMHFAGDIDRMRSQVEACAIKYEAINKESDNA